MRSPRSVTRAPIGMPSRSLKFEIAFFARVGTKRLADGHAVRVCRRCGEQMDKA